MFTRRTRHLVVVCLIAVLLWPAVGTVAGQSAPSSYYGPAVTEDGTPLPDGTTIVAVVDGTVQDQITVGDGSYGGGEPLDEKLRVDDTSSSVHFYVETDDGTRIEANRTDPAPTSGTERFPLSFPEGTVQPGSRFQVASLEPGDTTVLENETVSITANVTNRVAAGTETVTLRVDGGERATRSVTLGTDDYERVTFSLAASSLTTGEHTYGVTTEDDERTGTLTVAAATPSFTVSGFTASDTTVGRATTFDVSATVTNDGTKRGSQSVSYVVDGTPIDSTTVTLAVGEQTSVSFSAINSSQFQSGSHRHAVETANDSRSGTLTVEGPTPPTFAVTALDPERVTIVNETTVDLAATVANTGTRTGSQQVRLLVDDEQYYASPVSLAGGERTTVAFTVDVSSLDQGSHTYSFASANDSRSGTLTAGREATPTRTPTVTTTATEPTEHSPTSTVSVATDSPTEAEASPSDESATGTPSPTTVSSETTAPTTAPASSTTTDAVAPGTDSASRSPATDTTTPTGGGLFSMGLLQTIALSLLALVAVVYGVLKALAIYLGY